MTSNATCLVQRRAGLEVPSGHAGTATAAEAARWVVVGQLYCSSLQLLLSGGRVQVSFLPWPDMSTLTFVLRMSAADYNGWLLYTPGPTYALVWTSIALVACNGANQRIDAVEISHLDAVVQCRIVAAEGLLTRQQGQLAQECSPLLDLLNLLGVRASWGCTRCWGMVGVMSIVCVTILGLYERPQQSPEDQHADICHHD